jgi:hypothetical protein
MKRSSVRSGQVADSLIRKTGFLAESEAISMTRQICQGMSVSTFASMNLEDRN